MTIACWPVFELIIDFDRHRRSGSLPPPSEYIFAAKAALDKAKDLAFGNPDNQRAWDDRVKAMLVYFIDYRILNSEWDEGAEFWFHNRLETDPDVLGHMESLGGEQFFDDCNKLQADFDVAQRHNRDDAHQLAEQLSLYLVCIRLGFRGMYHDDKPRLDDYARKLWNMLPAYKRTHQKEMFPDAYRHNIELDIDYNLGMKLSVVLVVAIASLLSSMFAFKYGWTNATEFFDRAAKAAQMGQFFEEREFRPGGGDDKADSSSSSETSED